MSRFRRKHDDQPSEVDDVLRVEDLRVSFHKGSQPAVEAVHGVSFAVPRGRTLGIVGESGSGKSVTAMALVRLLDPRQATVTGRVLLNGVDLLKSTERQLRRVRGGQVGFVFQDPLGSLNPSMKIGRQMTESLRLHGQGGGHEDLAAEMLRLVGITDPSRRLRQYPHELSGGMRQRVMIAAALISRPALLVLDEPTTALDVTIQAQNLQLLKELKATTGVSMIFISHDLGVVAQVADEVAVMYAGRIVEQGPTADVLHSPVHQYTAGLLACRPRLSSEAEALVAIPGVPPSIRDHAQRGCSFAPRCAVALPECRESLPELVVGQHSAACWVPATKGLAVHV